MIFDHIGVFVEHIQKAREEFGRILPVQSWGDVIDDVGMNVSICFGDIGGGLRYELVAPYGDPNPVSGVLRSGKNILNHVAYRVPDFDAAGQRLRATGALPLGPPQPAKAFAGRRVVFFLTALGFIIELVEDAD